MQLSEKCFRPELLHLAQNQETDQSPHPFCWINFVTEGLDILEQWYTQGDAICQLIHNVSFDALESD